MACMLAIWDGKILSLVTDRFSEKPLFYYQDHDRLYFLQTENFYECITNNYSLNKTKFFDLWVFRLIRNLL